MALLQIGPGKEGGDSPGGRKPRPAVGIDLGTTNSLVALASGETARVIGGPGGSAIVPSVVSYGEEGVAVGDDARRLDVDPDNTFSSVKRLIGKSLDEIKRSSYKFRFAEGEGMVRLQTRRGPKTPVEMSAEILRVLRERAEAHAGAPVRDAVITVPAYFDDAQRQATKDAASLAGLGVLRLLNEPTAAAIAYGLDSGDEGIHVVYDLGGGTFDVSVLRLARGVFEVMATGGDAALGGDDFDALLARRLLDGAGITGEPRSLDWRRALESARALKEKLTDAQSASVECSLSSGTAELSASRDELEDVFSGLVGRTISILKGVMRDAKLGVKDVDAVVLVGGSTRMPQVREAIRGHFGMEPKAEIDPDQVVAIGAAIQADVLAGNRGDGPLLLDVIPLSLGIEIGGGLVERIIPRNTTVPIARAQHFTTQVEGQTKIKIHVVQGERELAEKCRSLAQFDLSGIPPMPAGTARVKVTFQVDMDGLLTVSAVEESTDSKARVEVKPSYGLEEGEIAAMLEQSYAHAADDRDERSLIESREEAIQMVTMLKSALERDGARLMDADSLSALKMRIREVEEIASGKDADRIREACKLLDEESAEFSEKRMDMAIKSTLKGKRVEEVGP